MTFTRYNSFLSVHHHKISETLELLKNTRIYSRLIRQRYIFVFCKKKKKKILKCFTVRLTLVAMVAGLSTKLTNYVEP